MRLVPALFLVACAAGPAEETVVDELRVLAAVAEAPEIRPGETTVVDALVVDPQARGAETMMWTCTRLGPTCLESEIPVPRVTLGEPDDEQFAAVVGAPTGLPATDEPQALVEVWILACEPGLCPIFDLARDDDPELDAWLDRPDDWMADLPLEGVSLASRRLQVSTRDASERHVNPELVAEPVEPPEPGATWTLPFYVGGLLAPSASLSAYSTSGGFERPGVTIAGDEASLDWYAPEEPGEVRLYGVLTDDLGGSAVWRGSVIVD